jgi:hypothetical protein
VFITALAGLSLQVLWMMIVLWWHTVFPIWAIYISSSFVLLGGGTAVVISIVLSVTSDVTAEDTRSA